MSKLVKPIEYATSQGISRQAVYAKIKKGTLESKTVDGKMYIVVDEDITEKKEVKQEKVASHLVDVKELLKSKEETIATLKESISDLKHTNTEINTTLRGEIELLKQVFTEMRNLYVKQVDYMIVDKKREIESQSAPIEAISIENIDNEDECWITLEEFFVRCKITKDKRKHKIVKRLRKAFMKNDERIKIEKDEIYLSCYHYYEDILNKK